MKRPDFKTRCRNECTRNVIFLFQRRVYNRTGYPDDYLQDDDSNVYDPEDTEMEHPLTGKQLNELCFGDFDTPCAIEEWHTENVFLSREEGEQWGKSHAYNYPDGWRVYGVCAIGELADLIKNT